MYDAAHKWEPVPERDSGRDFAPRTRLLDGKVVLVTGGTGSFGRRFVREVLATQAPRKLIVFSRDELKQYEMRQELAELFPKETLDRMRFFLGDVRDRARMELAFRGVDVVVHAAALKQVPAAEYNPSECIQTNVMGAENVVWACLHNHVEKVIALSTDKACSPINLYGATKLASDKTFVAANNLAGDIGTRFSVVRYGNVMGSRGSVAPLFQRLLDQGVSELPITDERMTRFWITLDQAVTFVLDSLAQMGGGEVYVPKIPSMRVVDMAEAIAPDAERRVIGIRPGEKLHEMLVTEDESRHSYELDDRFVIFPEYASWPLKDVEGGARMAEGFRYSSDSNDWWLGVDELRDIAAGVKAVA